MPKSTSDPASWDIADPNNPDGMRRILENEESRDEIEGAYKEASRRFVRAMDAAFYLMGDAKQFRVAYWQAAYAFGLSVCQGVSIRERARRLGVSSFTIHKGALNLCRALNLPPSEYMRAETKQ